jgi:hypothetical protein
MLGTAFAQPGVLLVEQPGPWGPAGLSESRFDPELARALESRARAAGLRPLAIRRPGTHAERSGPRRWAVLPADRPAPAPTTPADPLPAPRPAEHHRRRTLTWSSFTDDAELLDVPLDGRTGTPDPEPLYLVCAHSKRDVCCALRGRPLAADLQRLRPGRVWECSHTGGHRFAPNLLVLPLGALYGRVPDGGAAELVAAADRDEVIAALLRGLTGHPPVEQVALGRLLARRGVAAPAEAAIETSTEVEPGRWQLRLTDRGRPWRAEIAVDTVAVPFSSCGTPAAKPQPRYTVLDLAPEA